MNFLMFLFLYDDSEVIVKNLRLKLLWLAMLNFPMGSCTTIPGNSKHIREDSTMIISLPSQWKLPLHPALQHSAYEDLILSHEFESLVYRDFQGKVHPLAAVSFEVNSDHTVYRFKIDRRRRFSDGSFLSAADFKKSWEQGLLQRSNSANKNQIDGLFLVEGFSDFETSKTISGIKVISDDLLEIHYTKPFRLAASHLAGSRYGAFKVSSGKIIGTGKYAIDQKSNQELLFYKNIFHPEDGGVDRIKVVYLKDQIRELESGDVDVAAFNTQVSTYNSLIGATESFEVGSSWLLLNGIDGRIFSNPRLRKAFQALTWEIISKKLKENPDVARQMVRFDAQVYPEVLNIRLPREEVDRIISEGVPYIPELIEATKKTPIKIYISGVLPPVYDDFVNHGLKIEKLEFGSFLDVLQDMHHDFTADVISFGAGFNLSDPDGVYHLLGKNGAISSPMIHRANVVDLLESGRDILGSDQIGKHYKKVASAVLDEVPGIHLGYLQTNSLYRKDRVAIDPKFMGKGIRKFYIYQKVNE